MEFSFNSVHYLYNYYIVCTLLSHGYHVTTSCNVTCDVTVTCDLWPWSCDTFLYSSLCTKSKEKKRNINNNLAIFCQVITLLPMHHLVVHFPQWGTLPFFLSSLDIHTILVLSTVFWRWPPVSCSPSHDILAFYIFCTPSRILLLPQRCLSHSTLALSVIKHMPDFSSNPFAVLFMMLSCQWWGSKGNWSQYKSK